MKPTSKPQSATEDKEMERQMQKQGLSATEKEQVRDKAAKHWGGFSKKRFAFMLSSKGWGSFRKQPPGKNVSQIVRNALLTHLIYAAQARKSKVSLLELLRREGRWWRGA